MITVYNTASAFYWYPVKFNLQGGQMESFYRKYTFNNGIVFNGHNFLYQAMDYADNNNQLVFLTDMISASEIFSVKEAPKQQTDLEQIISTMSDSDGFIIKSEVQYYLLDSDNIIKYVSRTYLKKMDRKSISDVDILKFTIDKTDKDLIFIENENGQVLTCNSLGENETYFDTKIQPYVDKQRFEFFLSDDGQISFFLAGSNNKLALTTSSITNNFILTSVNLDIQQFRLPNNLIFNLNSYNRLDSNSSYIPNSKLGEYNNSPIDPI